MTIPLTFASSAFAAEDQPTLRPIHSQPSFVLATGQVEVAVTQLGGHMAPVTFFRDSDHPVQPYHVTPWQDEALTDLPAPVLVPLRGDFFCLPFGGNAEAVDGEAHPPHGEVAGSSWTHVGTTTNGDVTTLSLDLETRIRNGRVTKTLSLVDGQNVVYSRHLLTGFTGRMPLGHHATLALPDEEGSVRIATSPIRFGMTSPGQFSNPALGEYQALQPGQKWTSLTNVPRAWKDAPAADLTRLPVNPGFADLVQLVTEPGEQSGGPAWTTATFAKQGHLWFSLKDPDLLRTTVIWLENRGRHGRPWNGRNNCVGLEDVTACFADGLAASIGENPLSREGVETAVELRPDAATAVNYIQGVVKIPPGFETVKSVEFGPGEVTFVSPAGVRVTAPVRHEFIKTGAL